MEGELKKVANTHFFNHCFYKNLITNQEAKIQFDFKCANKLGKPIGFRDIKNYISKTPFFLPVIKWLFHWLILQHSPVGR